MNARLKSPPPPDVEALRVDDLLLEVRRSERRKVLQLTVDRGGELIVSAPPHAPAQKLEAFVREKRFWIYTKLAEKELRQQPAGRREFVSGECFSYLGRNYRLQLVRDQEVPLQLSGGRFRLLRGEAPRGRDHFIHWYTGHGLPWLSRRTGGWSSRMNLTPKGLNLRDLGYRWGSCSKTGVMNLHWATMLLPPTIIDYVIVHELCHLRHRNHTPEFWRLVERTMPDFAERKAWLATAGGKLLGL